MLQINFCNVMIHLWLVWCL